MQQADMAGSTRAGDASSGKIELFSSLPAHDASWRTVDAAWEMALARYRTLHALAQALPNGHPGENAAIDDYGFALDALIGDTMAPNLRAVALKLALAEERVREFDTPIFEADLIGIRRDVARLAKRELNA